MTTQLSDLSGPLHIDYLATSLGGKIALTHCPGRNTVDARGRRWQRQLSDDLATIHSANISTVVSLISLSEMKMLGVPDLPTQVVQHQLQWLQLVIEDFGTPDLNALESWQQIKESILAALARRETVLLHCAAGLGRTGMVAACLLVACGQTPAAAIAQVRAARPGTIETEAQEAFVQAVRQG
jgi:ADP-ribosyl-[dinitrogen reductase] hydrolase